MNIRPFVPSDAEILYDLYSGLSPLIPSHPRVEYQQFSRQLHSTLWTEWPQYYPAIPRGHFLPENNISLVATINDRPVAFATGAFLEEPGEYLPARTGLLRFLFSKADQKHTSTALIHKIVEHTRNFGHSHFFGLHYSHGPLFHNFGSALLSTTWAWMGQSFLEAGFDPVVDRYTMRRTLAYPIKRLPLAAGIEMRPAGKLGYTNGTCDYCHMLFRNGEQIALCECYFGEKMVQGTGQNTLYIAELFVEDAYRGQGLARFSVRDAMAHAKSAGAVEVILRTEFDNFPAISLYHREGFELVDTLCWFRLRT